MTPEQAQANEDDLISWFLENRSASYPGYEPSLAPIAEADADDPISHIVSDEIIWYTGDPNSQEGTRDLEILDQHTSNDNFQYLPNTISGDPDLFLQGEFYDKCEENKNQLQDFKDCIAALSKR